jgi:hypothetical protein
VTSPMRKPHLFPMWRSEDDFTHEKSALGYACVIQSRQHNKICCDLRVTSPMRKPYLFPMWRSEDDFTHEKSALGYACANILSTKHGGAS